mmetsp:Transcript_27126/g.54262  ORF Transcript_27126/g.54262 Transcript_27126/m.54262 type:complete len:540 (+) Transcript_27126:77-1696(+)|eukprot:CAMPEP_0194338386 /NCGR_PEP_ID=MMETSP0171-20130528/79400_1 /TAXON_ID=218684 /ORGANISM="Corethron pennatum, Strain L29A3" /LENGTH=539 /DNA_ID=CAMNT_0039102487 /DNA_START=32 /DNA_END=1651 /DNA_ORIENTATION=+
MQTDCHYSDVTAAERSLLDLYGTVREYESVQQRLEATAARAKLANAEAKHQAAMVLGGTDGEGEIDLSGTAPAAGAEKGKKRGRRKSRKRKVSVDGGDGYPSDGGDSGADSFDGSDSEYDSDDNEITVEEKRERKLQALREEVAGTNLALEKRRQEEEEEKILIHLGETTDGRSTFSENIKKKSRNEFDEEDDQPSLIGKLRERRGAPTPPHDFNTALDMSIDTGRMLFPTNPNADPKEGWTPTVPSQSASMFADDGPGPLELKLVQFESARAAMGLGNNTLAIKFTAPDDSKRFSLNIAAAKHNSFQDVLLHFNPRQFAKHGQLIINNRQDGTWGQGISVPLATLPLMFGQPCTVVVQIHGDGFDIFVSGKHCARLEHRSQLPQGKCDLVLQLPNTDDYGSPESWTVHKVWWGHKMFMAESNVSHVPGFNAVSQIHKKKIFVHGLTKISTEQDIDLRRAELERAFKPFSGLQGATVIVPSQSTFAFVEFDDESQAKRALVCPVLLEKFRMNLARRTRHEVLEEKRAAAKKLEEKDEWD